MSGAPFIDLKLPEPRVEVQRLPGDGYLLTSPVAPDPYPDNMIVHLRRWAEATPDRDFLCERDTKGDWRRLSYARARTLSANIAQALLDRGYGPDQPLAILSDNSIDFGLLMLGAMHIGMPVMPVSAAYSLMSQDHAKLKAVIAHHDPALIYVGDAGPFAKALAALDMSDSGGSGRALLTSAPSDGAETLSDWMAVPAGPAVEEALAGIGPDTLAKILLTSGSTGLPKGVMNTQRMMCSNQTAVAQAWTFLKDHPPVIVDWLPWNHTFGGNFCFNMILHHGGTFYIDEGRPVPGRHEATLRNLREIPSTFYLNVPRGFDMLIPAMEADAELRDRVFEKLDALFFAGAAMPVNLRRRLQALTVAARGLRLPIMTSLGATETAPACTTMHWDNDISGNLGVPLPGVAMKMVPNGTKLEVRFKGPNITPGYYKRPELAEEMFDEDGFFRIGDAARFQDPDDPLAGVVFDGRVAENFKLLSGTWVHAGVLRLAAIAAAEPVIQDAVITGHDREQVGLLVFPSLAGCRSLCPNADASTPLQDLIRRPEVQARLAEGLKKHNAENPGGSTRIVRALLMTDPPSIDANEITDKGYINQRAVVECRAALIDRLYSDDPGDDVVVER